MADQMQTQQKTIFISAAETSGDKHAANLIRQLRMDIPHLICQGIGGNAMQISGCNLLVNLVDKSAMLGHALRQVGFFYRLKRQIRKHFLHHRPDVVVVIDSPAWNFHVAQMARQMDIPVLYYIAPQLWAWGSWRVNKLRRSANRVACILPFEEQWFRNNNIPAEYVGHPLFDDSHQVQSPSPWQEGKSLFPTIALLPGSRSHELEKLWRPMMNIARRIREEFPDARFRTAASSPKNLDYLKKNAYKDLNIDIRIVNIEAACRHADLTLVASGTATLEVAAQNCPMIILYPVHPLAWNLIGRWLVNTRFLSLVNILAGKELAPEYMPFYARQTPKVASHAITLLQSPDQLQQIRLRLRDLMEPLLAPGAAQRVSKIVQELLPCY